MKLKQLFAWVWLLLLKLSSLIVLLLLSLLAECNNIKIGKKKIRRMRILGARAFPSLLAGEFKIFKQMLTTWKNWKKKKTAHAYFKRPYFF